MTFTVKLTVTVHAMNHAEAIKKLQDRIDDRSGLLVIDTIDKVEDRKK